MLMMAEMPPTAMVTSLVLSAVLWKMDNTWLTTLVTKKQAATPPMVRLDSIVNFDVSPRLLHSGVQGISFLMLRSANDFVKLYDVKNSFQVPSNV